MFLSVYFCDNIKFKRGVTMPDNKKYQVLKALGEANKKYGRNALETEIQEFIELDAKYLGMLVSENCISDDYDGKYSHYRIMPSGEDYIEETKIRKRNFTISLTIGIATLMATLAFGILEYLRK
jgi:hypothetical protein